LFLLLFLSFFSFRIIFSHFSGSFELLLLIICLLNSCRFWRSRGIQILCLNWSCRLLSSILGHSTTF
jgi:hypothetical protein